MLHTYIYKGIALKTGLGRPGTLASTPRGRRPNRQRRNRGFRNFQEGESEGYLLYIIRIYFIYKQTQDMGHRTLAPVNHNVYNNTPRTDAVIYYLTVSILP